MCRPGLEWGYEQHGERLRQKLTAEYELDVGELQLVQLIVSQLDRIDELDGIVAREGLVIHGTRGSRLHPAAAESRQLSLSVARLLTSLRVEGGGQERRGLRGFYEA